MHNVQQNVSGDLLQALSLEHLRGAVSPICSLLAGPIIAGYAGQIDFTGRCFDCAGAATYMPETDSIMFVPVRHLATGRLCWDLTESLRTEPTRLPQVLTMVLLASKPESQLLGTSLGSLCFRIVDGRVSEEELRAVG